MEDIIIALGEIASGKTTFSKFISQHYGYDVYEIGDFVRREYQRISPDIPLARFADSYYQKGKLAVFVNAAIRDAKLRQSKRIVFCGLRTLEELNCVTAEYPQHCIIKIICSSHIRAQRYKKEVCDDISILERNRIEKNWTRDFWDNIVPDYQIENNCSLESFYQQIKDIFETEGRLINSERTEKI